MLKHFPGGKTPHSIKGSRPMRIGQRRSRNVLRDMPDARVSRIIPRLPVLHAAEPTALSQGSLERL